MSQCTPISGNTPISGCTPTYLTRYWPYNGVPENMGMHSLPQGTTIYVNAFPYTGIPQYMGTHPKIMEYPSSLGINHGRQTCLCSFSVLANCRTHTDKGSGMMGGWLRTFLRQQRLGLCEARTARPLLPPMARASDALRVGRGRTCYVCVVVLVVFVILCLCLVCVFLSLLWFVCFVVRFCFS